ncbi:uncharacterized protein FIBRA_08135 [Fibroporia radiculosa]|uniref:Zn(2)-C6 fungal-type domain-containing protein n=1 Tax=Fibroporia radiculosa TaxID=599839 RepID=J4I289_9APHY|nr:uncharacterized protein FIBRA_08135 [Fibroporia radiculosa]CCM05897.1 predicted protein [Fibroporia radiculosa]
MPPIARQATGTGASEGGKIKQTRQRQRLSCVECTKRRQKCDRHTPCGLCVSRGVAHLCRWEPVVSRPAPQQSPAVALANSASETIQALSARIAVLEQTLLRQNLANGVDTLALPESSATSKPLHALGNTSGQSGENDDDGHALGGPHALYDYDMQVAAVALAQLSLAPREEYIGDGTVLCALHELGSPETWRFPYSRSSMTTRPACYSQHTNTHPFSAPIRALLAALPPRQRVEQLVDGFFAERNWEFGLPENWFRSSCTRMWAHLDIPRCPGFACLAPTLCTACQEEVNPHWISLLFAVLALAPRRLGADAHAYFTHAVSAKRLGEDILLAVRAYALSERTVHGAVLSCIASGLLGAYLSDRGRVSEAWKLTGAALRTAQANGLHRDPGWRKWEEMGKEEAELRLFGWWLLWCADRMFSFVLGRPMMAPRGTYDVTLIPGPVHGDGSPNPNAAFQRAFVTLCDIIGDGVAECLSLHAPSYATVLATDRKFREWQARLPPEMQWRDPRYQSALSEPTTLAERNLAYQRQSLAAYYLGALMNIHRPHFMHPSLAALASPSNGAPCPNPSREQCIVLALELVRELSTVHSTDTTWVASPPATLFHYPYFVFDGAVALAGAVAQTPPHPCETECLDLMDRALRMLHACTIAAENAIDGEGEVAMRAVSVLEALRKAARRRRGGNDVRPDRELKDAQVEESASEQLVVKSLAHPMVIGDTSTGAGHTPMCGYDLAFSSSSEPTALSMPFADVVENLFPAASTGSVDTAQMGSYILPQGLFCYDVSAAGARMQENQSKVSLQSLMTPFDVLQGRGDSMEWARLAGMENWETGDLSLDLNC